MKSNDVYPTLAYVGCFSSEKRKGHGKGISVYRVDAKTGAWNLVQICETIQNPGFVVLDGNQKFLYAAHGSSSEVSSYSIEPQTGKLRMLNTQQTSGDNSPHITISPSNGHVVVANGPGMAVFPVNKDGSLAPASDVVVPPGEPGPYRHEQKGAHPHQVVFDLTGRFMLVPDKGIDKVHVYRLDASSGKVITDHVPSMDSRRGAAPRHVAIHPARPYAYVVNELDSTVTAYHWNSERGELKPVQVITTLPTTYTGNNIAAEIAIVPSGNFVYASNRGHNSIVTFAVELKTGMLEPVGWEPTQGKTPRFFTLDSSGNRLYAANQSSDTIVVFDINAQTGKLTPTGQVVETGTPTCIAFAYH